jgi:hypothetical protein
VRDGSYANASPAKLFCHQYLQRGSCRDCIRHWPAPDRHFQVQYGRTSPYERRCSVSHRTQDGEFSLLRRSCPKPHHISRRLRKIPSVGRVIEKIRKVDEDEGHDECKQFTHTSALVCAGCLPQRRQMMRGGVGGCSTVRPCQRMVIRGLL